MELIPARWQKLLKGPGSLTLQAAPEIRQCLSENRPFPPETARGNEGLMILSVGGEGRLELKLPPGNMDLGGKGEACGLLDLVWPDEPDDTLAAMGFPVPIPADQVAVVLLLSGQLMADTGVGPAIGAAGEFRPELRYARLYPAGMGSQDMLRDFLDRFILPTRLGWPQRTVDENSRVSINWQGTLDFQFALGAETAWSGTRTLPFFHLAIQFAGLTGAAGRLAGHFQHDSGLELRLHPSALGPEWLQAELRLGQANRSEIGGGFNAWARMAAGGSGQGLESWLTQLLGLDVARILEILRGLAEAGRSPEGPVTGLKRLILGEVFEPQLRELEAQLLGVAAIDRFRDAITRLQDLDAELRRQILRHLGRLDQVRGILAELAVIPEAARISVEIGHWLAGQGVHLEELLEAPKRWERWRKELAGLLDPDNWRLLERLGKRLQTVSSVRQALADLAREADPAVWLERADERLRGWAELLLGQALAEVPVETLKRLLDASAWVSEHFDRLGAQMDRAVGNQLDRGWQMAMGLAYARSRTDERLVTADFHLRSAQGRDLFRRFALGDLSAAWLPESAGKVRLIQGRFMRELQRSLAWDLKLGPLGLEILEGLAVKQSLTLRSVGFGWEQEMVLSARGMVQRKQSDVAYQQSALEVLAQASGVLSAPDLEGAWAWPVFRAHYALNAEDPATRPDELKPLLELAERMRLLGGKSPADLVEAVLGTDPPFPAVKLCYSVSIPSTLLPALWRQAQVHDRIAQAVLDILEWSYLRYGSPSNWLRVLGGAINVSANQAAFHRRGHLRGLACYAQVGPAQGKRRRHLVRLGELDQRKLESLYRLADSAGTLFQGMSNRCQAGPLTPAEIESFARELAELHNRLARWGLRLDTFPHLLAVLARRAGLFQQISAALELEVSEPETGAVSRWVFTPSA